MEDGMETRSNKLFMLIAIVLTGSLFLGLVGIGGLVVFRLVSGPPEVAMPPEDIIPPTQVPIAPATPTPSPLASATPTTPAPTATLVVPAESAGAPAEEPANSDGHDGAGLNSPGPDSSEMPQTGFGLLETAALGFILMCLLGGARVSRHLRAQR
jgi:nitrate reductase NapE component